MEYLKTFLTKLKTTSAYKQLRNNFFIIVLGISLLFISLKYPLFWIVFGAYLYYIYKQNKIVAQWCLLSVCIILIHFVILQLTRQPINGSVSEYSGKIIDVKYYEDYLAYTLKTIDGKVIVYADRDDILIGDIVNITGKPRLADTVRIPNGYDYQRYLQRQGIIAVISSDDIEKTTSTFHPGRLKQFINRHLQTKFSEETRRFLSGILLGDNYLLTEGFQNALISGGIIHLFAISGLHIQLFVLLLARLLNSIKIKENNQRLFIYIFLLLYLIITSFTPSVLRASLMYLLSQLNRSFKLKLTSLDVVSIIFIILMIYNPYYIYHFGFLLSFMCSFILIIFSPITNHLSPSVEVVVLSALIQLMTLPVVVNLNNSFNLFSPLLNVGFIYIVSSFVLPFAMFMIFVPAFDFVFKHVIVLFIKLTIFISNTINFEITFPLINGLELLLLILISFLLIKFFASKRLRILLSICLALSLLLISNRVKFSPYLEIYFLDLYDGEATFIKAPFDKGNILIDTGDGRNEVVTSFLKSLGVKRIDYLVLTHNHRDHNGEALNIINNFVVKHIIVHKFDNSYYSKLKNTLKLGVGDYFTCYQYTFKILNPHHLSSDENENSLVIQTQINNLNFLFLGDATKTTEEQILPLIDSEIDVIKIAHHGSSTSTSPKFISALKPRLAIIMNGRIEKFAFPHQETLNTLDKYNIPTLTTKENYTIKYRAFYKKEGIFSSLNANNKIVAVH